MNKEQLIFLLKEKKTQHEVALAELQKAEDRVALFARTIEMINEAAEAIADDLEEMEDDCRCCCSRDCL